GGQPILRTRIIAPMEFRIQMVQARLKYSQREAIAYIEKVDEDRRKWTQFLYGVDWGDPSLYDIVLNLEHIDIEEACHIISSMVIERCFEFTPECQQKMDDLAWPAAFAPTWPSALPPRTWKSRSWRTEERSRFKEDSRVLIAWRRLPGL